MKSCGIHFANHLYIGDLTKPSTELGGVLLMVMYEFYCGDPGKKYELIGILPEKRKDPKRITTASVMNWGKNLSGNNGGKKGIFCKIVFYKIVAMGEYTGKLVRVTS